MKIDCKVIDRYTRRSETMITKDNYIEQMDKVLTDVLSPPRDKLSMKDRIHDQQYKVYTVEIKRVSRHSFDVVIYVVMEGV